MKYGNFLTKVNNFRSELLENFSEKADKFWKMGTKRLIGLFIIISGFIILSYSVIVPLYNGYMNRKRIDEVRNAISGILREDEKDSDKNNYQGTGMSKEEYDALSVSDKSKIEAQLAKERAAQATVSSQSIIGIVEIKKLNITYAVVEGTKGINIKASIGHISSSSSIGADGTCVLAGHRGGVYGEMFDNIDKLEAGDLIVVTDLSGTEYTYEVYDQKIIKPKDWSIQDWIDGQITLVLLTCDKAGTKRLCVMCRMVNVTKDENGEKVVDVLKPTTTQAPTEVPTENPTAVPRDPKFHVTITSEFGKVIYDQDTDENGGWSYDLPDGTYSIKYTYSDGESVTETKVVGSGVTSRRSTYIVTDLNERIIYVGATQEDGSYTMDLPNGDYIITFTDVFGQKSDKPIHVGP